MRFAPERATGDELRRLVEHINVVTPLYKIRLTGGEPTLAPDVCKHLQHAQALVGEQVGLTTNGVQVADKLADFYNAGMRVCNISIDAANATDFAAMTRRDEFASVLETIATAAQMPGLKVKLNAVAIKDFTDAHALLQLAIQHKVHLRFIEVMAIGPGNDLKNTSWFGAPDIQQDLFAAGWSLTPQPERDEATSRVWEIAGINPDDTTLGFITTSSEPFCGTCDRLRLGAQGTLHTCLFDEKGVDLLTDLRAGNSGRVQQLVADALAAKKPQEPVMHKNMAAIGG